MIIFFFNILFWVLGLEEKGLQVQEKEGKRKYGFWVWKRRVMGGLEERGFWVWKRRRLQQQEKEGRKKKKF